MVKYSVTLYGAEAWTMKKEDVKRIEAFEMTRQKNWIGHILSV